MTVTSSKNKVCARCDGKKWFHRVDDDGYSVADPCICLRKERARTFLGSELMQHKHVRSGLWSPELDRTDENLFIEGTWDITCGHLKWALMGKHRTDPSFTYRIIDDNKIVQVWLGAYAYKSRAQQERERSEETYNTVADLVEPPDLLIIRLGGLRYSNRAAGDVLVEALQQRGRVGKPCWIVEGDYVFSVGHPAYSEGGLRYISDHYERFPLAEEEVGKVRAQKQALKAKTLEALIAAGLNSGDMPHPDDFDDAHQSTPKAEPSWEPSSGGDLDLSLPGSDDDTGYKRGKRKKGRY